MRKFLTVLSAFALCVAAMAIARADDPKKEEKPVPPVLNFTMKSLAGADVNLAKYQGKVLLIVNTASKCGYTPQYKDLEALYTKYQDKGLMVLGFPANDFKNQEPGNDKQIAEFCHDRYGVTFDMFSKVVVEGDGKVPLFKLLTEGAADSGEIKWNFEKFLIGKDGQIVARFRTKVNPMSEEVVKAIEAELAKN